MLKGHGYVTAMWGLESDCSTPKPLALQVPDFGTVLKTKTGQTELLPTASNTLLIEAGCSAEKTRRVALLHVELLERVGVARLKGN